MRKILYKIYFSALLLVLLLSSCSPAPKVISGTTDTLLTISGSTGESELTQGSSATKATTKAPVETSKTPEIKPIKLPTLEQYQLEDLLDFRTKRFTPHWRL